MHCATEQAKHIIKICRVYLFNYHHYYTIILPNKKAGELHRPAVHFFNLKDLRAGNVPCHWHRFARLRAGRPQGGFLWWITSLATSVPWRRTLLFSHVFALPASLLMLASAFSWYVLCFAPFSAGACTYSCLQ